MTTQNVKLLERGSCIVYHFNREGRDSYTPRHKKTVLDLSRQCRDEIGIQDLVLEI
jgi:hypothetical protein